jgi:hypothetical protein
MGFLPLVDPVMGSACSNGYYFEESLRLFEVKWKKNGNFDVVGNKFFPIIIFLLKLDIHQQKIITFCAFIQST